MLLLDVVVCYRHLRFRYHCYCVYLHPFFFFFIVRCFLYLLIRYVLSMSLRYVYVCMRLLRVLVAAGFRARRLSGILYLVCVLIWSFVLRCGVFWFSCVLRHNATLDHMCNHVISIPILQLLPIICKSLADSLYCPGQWGAVANSRKQRYEEEILESTIGQGELLCCYGMSASGGFQATTTNGTYLAHYRSSLWSWLSLFFLYELFLLWSLCVLSILKKR